MISQETMSPLVTLTSDNAVAAEDLAAAESVTAIATAASLTEAAICGIEFCVLGAMAPPSVPSREPGGVKKRGKYTTLTMEKKAAIIKLIESGRSQLDVAG
ncbi:hypothetical protein MRX96_051133 [Rhipicephalus microplus]